MVIQHLEWFHFALVEEERGRGRDFELQNTKNIKDDTQKTEKKRDVQTNKSIHTNRTQNKFKLLVSF
jgi:hypothetical protein